MDNFLGKTQSEQQLTQNNVEGKKKQEEEKSEIVEEDTD